MKIKSKPIGEWTVQELADYCSAHDCGNCPLNITCNDNYTNIPTNNTVDIEIDEKAYEILKCAKRILELSGVKPKDVAVKSFGNDDVIYEYRDEVNKALISALFDIQLPTGEYSFLDLGIK